MAACMETFAGRLGLALALWLSFFAAPMVSFAQGTSNGPESYFHGAASKYIEGRHQEAKLQAEEGLRLFPENADLKRLAEHLNKLEEQKQQQQQEGGGRQEQKDASRDSTEQEQQPQEEQEQPEEEQEPEEEPAPEQADADTSSREEPPADTSQAPRPQPGEMSEEEAERLLDAYKDEEKEVQEKLQDRRGKSPRVEKDW